MESKIKWEKVRVDKDMEHRLLMIYDKNKSQTHGGRGAGLTNLLSTRFS